MTISFVVCPCDELSVLEVQTGLRLAGWLHDGRACLLVLLKPSTLNADG
jgi:hypothetical protein